MLKQESSYENKNKNVLEIILSISDEIHPKFLRIMCGDIKGLEKLQKMQINEQNFEIIF